MKAIGKLYPIQTPKKKSFLGLQRLNFESQQRLTKPSTKRHKNM